MKHSRRYHILIAMLVILAPARGETIAWPPEYMRHLPPAYLERLRKCMVTGTERLDRMRFDNSESKEAIGWVRYGQPALLLGRPVDEINRFLGVG